MSGADVGAAHVAIRRYSDLEHRLRLVVVIKRNIVVGSGARSDLRWESTGRGGDLPATHEEQVAWVERRDVVHSRAEAVQNVGHGPCFVKITRLCRVPHLDPKGKVCLPFVDF